MVGDMKRWLTVGKRRKTLTPEFARDYIRPFYEEVFERLRKFISEEKAVPSASIHVDTSKNLANDRNVKSQSGRFTQDYNKNSGVR